MTVSEIWLWAERHRYMALRVGDERITAGRESWSAFLRGMSDERQAKLVETIQRFDGALKSSKERK